MAHPETLRVVHENWKGDRFHYIGCDRTGNQFMAFVSGAFPESGPTTEWEKTKRWYAILHRFDPEGNHLSTQVSNGGTTAEGEEHSCTCAWKKLGEMLHGLDIDRLCDINIKPFVYEEEGYRFALVYEQRSYDDPGNPGAGYECVMLWPNDIMFHPPWDSGQYST
jgi:hypothetical protein